jgi:putative endonuclease
LTEHIRGQSDATATRRPFALIYCEYHACKVDALRRESYFKTSPGKNALKLMLRVSLESRHHLPDPEPEAR